MVVLHQPSCPSHSNLAQLPVRFVIDLCAPPRLHLKQCFYKKLGIPASLGQRPMKRRYINVGREVVETRGEGVGEEGACPKSEKETSCI